MSRFRGQTAPGKDGLPAYKASQLVDFELEMVREATKNQPKHLKFTLSELVKRSSIPIAVLRG